MELFVIFILLVLLVLCVCGCGAKIASAVLKRAGAPRKRFIIDPARYEIQYAPAPPANMLVALLDSENSVYPNILETPQLGAVQGQIITAADRPLEKVIVRVTPRSDVWEGQINVIRYDYITGDELERRVYKTHGVVGTRVPQYICPNDTTESNLPAAIAACQVPTYFAFDPARQVKPIVDMDAPVTHSNFNERAYTANLYENYDYNDIRPKSLYTRRQYERMQNRNNSSYTRIALSPPRAGLTLNTADWYQTNPFQTTSFAGPIYKISLLNTEGLINEGTDGLVQVTLYNQLSHGMVAGPITFNQSGMLAVGQEGKETHVVRGLGREAVPLQFIIVKVTNFDSSAWSGEVVVEAGESIVSYASANTEVGALKGELVTEYRCYDSSIYDNLDDAVMRCGNHREEMKEYIPRQIYLGSVPEQTF